jgi:ATP-dependent DNA helicase RecQ
MQAQFLIRYLEDEQLICFSEGYASRSTVAFIASRSELDDIEKSQPLLFEMASALLRTYGGILTEPAYISEKQLARIVRLPETAIIDSLKQLHRYRIIEYRPGTDQAMVTLLKNRMYRDDLRFDTRTLMFRKEQDEKRMKAILSYAETSDCRSVFIGHYFGDDNQQPCGVCDRCLTRLANKTTIQDSFFYKQFESALAHGQKLAVRDLLQAIPAERQQQGLSYLNWLEAEGKIGRDEQQRLHWIA